MREPEETPIKKVAGRKANILLVDDRPDKLLALRTVLEGFEENVMTAGSGDEALRLLLKHDFAVILLDVSMPGMDGFETARLIRQRRRSEHTPIIFVTSINTTDTHVTRGYSLGAVDYIFSPVEPEIMRAKVAVFIDLYRKTEQVRHQSELLRAAAEEKAALLESRLQSILNRLDVGVFRAGKDGSIFEANPAFVRLVGMGRPPGYAEFNLRELIGVEGMAAHLAGGASTARDVLLVRPDGTRKWISLTLAVQHEGANRIVLEGLAEDITERKEAEERLRQLNDTLEKRVQERTEALRLSQEHLIRSERLASLGTLAAGIAHEINNPLNAILMTATYAKRRGADIDMDQALGLICEEARRGGRIVKGILKFAKEETVNKATLNINDVIRHTRDLAKAYLNSDQVRIEVDLQEPLPFVKGNSTALEQVMINLINNSVEAAQGNASIRVATKAADGRVIIEFSDTGPGMSDEVARQIFDPFFSTKRQQGGTGLGLSICHGIVTEHGGTITVKSVLGSGTTFTIQFPGKWPEEDAHEQESSSSGR